MYTNRNRYQGSSNRPDRERLVTGVMVTNLGTPDTPTAPAVRRYLAEFLSDPRVVELPRWLWLPILYAIIVPIRPRRSAAAYRKIWTDEGSPLLVNSQRQADSLERLLATRCAAPVKVTLGMRYGRPSLETALQDLRSAGARHILVLPLYPQYSGTTTGSTYDAVFRALEKWRWLPDLRFVSDYHEHPGYIEALANSVHEAWQRNGRGQRLLLSFHGIPQRYRDAGDPYYDQCLRTAELVAERLGEPRERWAVAFQSRVGRAPWLQPYTEDLLQEWGRSGIRDIHVMCPGFSADCLETLEEIAMRDRGLFRSAGGEHLRYIAALNDREDHIEALADIVSRHAKDWQRVGRD